MKNGKKQRESKRKYYNELTGLRMHNCIKCGLPYLEKNGGHFIPPSFGDDGFWICDDQIAIMNGTAKYL
jgi:hypothetical protein